MMPTFTYKALTDSGTTVNGEKVAVSRNALNEELAREGLLVQQVRQKRTGRSFQWRRGVSPEAFLLFNHELMALIRAGLTLPDALALAAERPDEPELGGTLQNVLEAVRGGKLFSQACAQHPAVFDELYVATLRTGEKTGALSDALRHYQDYLKHKVAVRKKVSQALAYPLFLLITLVVILGILFTFVIPRFVQMYADFEAKMPWPTQLLIDTIEALPYTGPVLLGLIIAGVLGWRAWQKTARGRLWIDQLKERLPYVGPIQRLYAVSQVTRSLSALLAGGTPLVEAMATARDSLSNQVYAGKLTQASEQVTAGQSLAKAMNAQQLVPQTAIKMIEVGEASGNLGEMLADIAQYYEEMLDTRLQRALSLIEPLLMILMGLMVGTIVIVMYLPIFNMADVIR